MTVERNWTPADMENKYKCQSGSACEVDFSWTTKGVWLWGNSGTTSIVLSSVWGNSTMKYPKASQVHEIEGLKINNLRSNKQVWYTGWF